MFSFDDPYDYLDEEGRPVRTMICSDGHEISESEIEIEIKIKEDSV